jgi:hypothetical protein
MQHEPNVYSGNGTPAQFAGMYKHVMQMYDTWVGAGTKRIKFAVILSNPWGNVTSVANSWYQVGNGNDISKTGARQVDYFGWDVYFPQVEKGNPPVTPASVVTFGSTFGRLHTWTVANSAANTYEIIGEMAVRIETAPSSTGTAPSSTWPATFWSDATNGFIAWNNAHTLANGDHPLRYACQYASMALIKTGSTFNNGINGSIDNAITADTFTYDAGSGGFQKGGFSLRPAFTAWRTAKVALGDETMTGSAGTVPSTPTNPSPPTAGQTSTVINFTVPVADVSVNLYDGGVAVASAQGLTGTSVTVQANPNLPLPQTHSYTLTGIGTDNNETAASSALSVTFLAAAVTPPSTPSAPVVTDVATDSATATVTAVATATGYNWFLDSNTGTPDFTSTPPTVNMTPLSTGSHTVKEKAFNTGGASSLSAASSSFTLATAPDTTPPNVPTGLAVTASSSSALVTWSAVSDQPVAGATTSGMGTYDVSRSNSALAGSGTILNANPLTGTSFTDTSPPAVTTGPVTAYYFVRATDNAGNVSAWSTAVSATIPQLPTGTAPTSVMTSPSSVVQGQSFMLDGSQSIPGTGGAIASYSWNISFRGQLILSVGPQSAPSTTIRLTQVRQFSITQTVTDASTNTGTTTATLNVTPTDGATLPFSGGTLIVAGDVPSASKANDPLIALDQAAFTADSRLDDHDTAIVRNANPLAPGRRGALWCSMEPTAATTNLIPISSTGYVIRANTYGQTFTRLAFWNNSTSTSAITGSFFAVYDVAGNLMSPTGALTDASSLVQANGYQTITLDGGPFIPPLGVDNTDANTAVPTNEFFIYYYSGTLGTNKPQFLQGLTSGNFGTSTSAITPTQANISTVPFWSTTATAPPSSLNAPSTLGVLTPATSAIYLFALLP